MRLVAWLLVFGAVACHRAAPHGAAAPSEVPLPDDEHLTQVGDRVRPIASPLAIPAPGAKLTLINYFATWCGSSQRWMGEADRLQQKYKKRGLIVVGVAHWGEDDPVEADAFARKYGATYPVAFDAGHRIAKTVHPLSWGQSLVAIDPQGIVRLAHVGSSAEAMAAVDTQLDALLPREAIP
jgi:peroxiredoxin